MPENDAATDSSPLSATFNIADHLPLRLIKSETVPPAPIRTNSGFEPAVDWLYDFAGYTWITYGASSVLVISHFPNPLSEAESLIGPIFRQVFELSVDGGDVVSAVSWSPVTPSAGDLAAALDNCIGVFSYDPDISCNSSFSWSQNATLVQATKVEVIKWTVSGDGIISGGIEVVLWRKKEKSWERAWKFKPAVPHNLISAGQSIEGPLATAHLGKLQVGSVSLPVDEACKYVLVSYCHGDSKYLQAELYHPSPICMIQWRPSIARPLSKDARHPPRLVLLTSCLDGAVRLWSETDDGKVKKSGKDSCDYNMVRLSFRVVAVVEVNQILSGTLGFNVNVMWAGEVDGISGADSHHCSSTDYQLDKTGCCEWLIGFGPRLTVTFWAIHCLDDFSPMRYPRVTLWNRQELISQEMGCGGLLLNEVFISRNRLFGPPTTCSMVELLPCNSLAWLQLHSQVLPDAPGRSTGNLHAEDLLPSRSLGILDIDSHKGNILKVVVHPYTFEVGLAASLDANGELLFWSLTTASCGTSGLPTLNPSCKLSGRSKFSKSHLKYTSLAWAPSILKEDRVLVMGNTGGVDCFIIKFMENREKIVYHHLCTIPFGVDDFDLGPTTLCSIPLPSTCNKTFICNSFMLLAVWKANFQALSWKLTFHDFSPSNSFDCDCNIRNAAKNSLWTFDTEFSGKRYYISVHPFSSVLPAPYDKDMISSYGVIHPINVFPCGEQDWSSAGERYCRSAPYHVVTGCKDGSVKLWRSAPADLSGSDALWDLVGELAAHQDPVLAVSPSICGAKIATISSVSGSGVFTLHIWESVRLGSKGKFILEDTISFDSEVVALNWLMLGNGLLLLGVCLQHELKIYAQRRCGGNDSGEHVEGNIWVCIAVTSTKPAIQDFFWGPKATVGVAHLDYFCLFGHLSLWANKGLPSCFPEDTKDVSFISNECSLPTIFVDSDICDVKESLVRDGVRHFQSTLSMNVNARDSITLPSDFKRSKQKFDFSAGFGLWRCSEIAEMLGGPLPAFHPETLLLNIGTGNWKRAYVALQHLVENLASAEISGNHFRKDSQIIPQVPLLGYLEGLLPSTSDEKSFQWAGSADGVASSSQFQKGAFAFTSNWAYGDTNNAAPSSSIRSEPRDFVEVIDKHYGYVGIRNTEKIQIHAIIDILQEIRDPHTASAYGSLDEPGRRFWVAVRFQRLYFIKRYGRSPFTGESVVSSELIGWAFHSDCQENLFNSLLSNESSWQEMHDLGVGFWYSNATHLRVKMEKLAKQQYLKSKDPKACALLYIALNRIQVLAGLFKISKDEKDKPLVGFLSRNFQDEKNKAAALKNAYVLMGKHQLELATAFFLLGGDTYSAVNVCAKNLGDEQLALVICRLVDGYSGPLERHLISKSVLPSSISSGDYWLASLFEWILGDYTKAYLQMLGLRMNLTNNESAVSTHQKSFFNPSIGQFCLMLANKTNLKNAIGEQKAVFFCRWAIMMRAIALRRSGMPLEALECLSSHQNAVSASSQDTVLDNGDFELLNEVMKLPHNGNSSNWISGDLAELKELNVKSDFAMQYISYLLKEHPSWKHINMLPFGGGSFSEPENEEYRRSIEIFVRKITATLVCFQQKFSLNPFNLIDKIVLFLYNNGLLFIGYHMLAACLPRFVSPQEDCRCDSFLSCRILPNLFSMASGEVAIVSKYVASCSISCSYLISCPTKNIMAIESRSQCSVAWEFYQWSLIQSLWCLRAMLKLFFGSSADDVLYIPFRVLDLAEYCVYFASSWGQMNVKGLFMITKPVLLRFAQGLAPDHIIKDLNKILSDIRKIMVDGFLFDNKGAFEDENMHHERAGGLLTKIPKDERWIAIGFSLWGQISSFFGPLLNLLTEKIEVNSSLQPSSELGDNALYTFGADSKDMNLSTALLPFPKLLHAACSHISVYSAQQLASYLLLKGDGRITATFLSLKDGHTDPFSPPKYFSQRFNINAFKNDTELRASEIFWHICSDPYTIPGFIKGNLKWFEFIKQNPLGGWGDVYTSILRECEGGEIDQEEERIGSSSKAGSPVACLTPNDHPFLSSTAEDTKKVVPFNSPKEIYRRTGALLETLCINSIDHHQAALATNQKGIIYFNWDDGLPGGDGSEYIWADADWPHNGWAGSESTPIPTCVYPGVGLGSKKGTHLGLGGATVGAGHSMRPARELMNGGVLGGVPGYSSMGVSSLGWGIQDDFEQFVDPTPTTGSVSPSSFSTHPSMPLFLVGSGNTHVYLWEFGKDRATATYGVLPAANVPPPYALASISAVRFDRCGHRFVTGALDGTVCTWQLEVGGRSNVGPTESLICFDNHTSDVSYVTPSGSIIAAAGYSSNGINVVIWDTLAPMATSRASIMCHEGGTRSLSVFDKNLGSGSISPLIVTGGKAGDVGLHDFRYIATGKTKKHKHNDASEPNGNMSPTVDMQSKTGDQNRNGMVWYIPKAHAGSVSKVATIPNTSFFLTGSKDGDVKLWDAKRARLVFHWPRLHERHTFLQPSSRGFGGVVRAGVTDIQVFSHGFLTCGGDGTVKLIQLGDFDRS